MGEATPFASLAHSVVSVTEAPERAEVARRSAWQRRGLLLGDVLGTAAAGLLVLGDLTGVLLVVLVALVLTRVLRLHERDQLVLTSSTVDDIPQLAEVAGLTTLAAFLAGQVDGATAGSELLAAVLVGLVLGRLVARAVSARVSGCERCLLVGDDAAFELLQRKLQGARRERAQLVALLPLDAGDGAWDGVDLYGALDDMRGLIDRLAVDRVIIAPTASDSATTLELIRLAKAVGVKVSLVPRLFEVIGSSVEFDQVEGLPVLAIRRFGLSPTSRGLKRGFDLLVGSVAVVLVAPLLAAIALLVKRDSPGPVLFRQLRIGTDGEAFEVLKFRTMVADAEEQKAALQDANVVDGMFKIPDDPRITRIGKLLRRTSLDELPQLLNVVRGEMSIVGPRPLIPEEDGRISGWNRRRLELKPGMTGPWQVMPSARIPLQEMAAIDYLYVATWSLWADVKIMLRTVGYVLGGGGR